MDKIQFILFYTTFFFFIAQVTGMAGQSLISGVTTSITPPPAPTSILDTIGYVVNNIGFFFSLMTISTTYMLFGILIVSPFIITMLWILLEMIRGI